LAQELKEIGFQTVRQNTVAVGGAWRGEQEGPVVVLSSNDPSATLEVLKTLASPERGTVLVVFGPEVKLSHGDYLIKLDYTDELEPDVVALPISGPSIDTFELVISEGQIPTLAIASDLVLTLQNRARTASEFVVVQLEHYRPQEDGTLAIDLSLRVFNPAVREPAARALVSLSKERLASHRAELLSVERTAAADSGRWPVVREALGTRVRVVQEQAPLTQLSQEDFGRPKVPALTLRVGAANKNSNEALAQLLRRVLSIQR